MNKPAHHNVNMRKHLRLSHEWLRTASSGHSFIPKMQIAGYIEMLINSDQPARYHTPEDSNLQVNTNSHTADFLASAIEPYLGFCWSSIEQSDSCFMAHKKWRRHGYLGILSFYLYPEQWKKKKDASRPQHKFRRPSLPGLLQIPTFRVTFYEHFASSSTCYWARTYHNLSLDQSNNISWCVNIMKLLIT